jgi:hypothetical protein
MAHPLDGARLKVVRAYEHLETLKLEIIEYIEKNPPKFNAHSIVPVEKDGSAWHTEFNIESHPDPHISAVLGDCINNARHALDYIAWALATRYSPRPLVIGKDKPYFPIYDGFIKGERAINNSFSGYSIPTAAIDEIKSVQPYSTGGILPYGQPLWILHYLTNGDKHRLPVLTIGNIANTSITISRKTLPADSPPNSRFADGRMDVKGQATIMVAFEDSLVPHDPVDRTIENIVRCVEGIVPRFERFFT